MQLFANNAISVLASALTNVATSLALKAGDGAKFPTPTGGDFFTLTLVGRDANGIENSWEVVNVTARSVDTLTIVRAQEGTTAAAWGVGTPAQARATAAALTTLQSTANTHIARTDNPHTVTKAQVGLGNVDNTSDVNKPVSTAQAAADAAALASAKTYADGLVVGLWDDRGNYDASGNTFPAAGGSGAAGAVLKGDIWTTSVAGTVGGTPVAVKQTLRALIDAPGQTAANWAIGLANTDLDDSITAGVTGRAPSQNAVAAALALKTTAATLAAAGGAALVGVTPTASLVATAVQAALAELDAKKAKLNGDATQDFALFSVNGGPLAGLHNKIINGDMSIDQRYVGAAVVMSANSFGYIADRWQVGNNRAAAVLTAQRVSRYTPSTSLNPYAMRVTMTNGAALAASDNINLTQCIEGFNIVDLGWGTAAAKPLTIAFSVTASVAGNYALAVRNASVNRCYVTHFNVAAAGVEQNCSVTIPGETSGSWASDNSPGAYISFDLGIGSTYSTASLNTWVTTGNVFGSTTSVKLSTVANATFEVTNVRAVAGSVAPPMEPMSFAAKLLLCQRYFCKTMAYNVPAANNQGTAGSLFMSPPPNAGYHGVNWTYPVVMRVSPTINSFNVTTGSPGYWRSVGENLDVVPGVLALSDRAAYIALNNSSLYTPTAGGAWYIHVQASAEF